MIVVFFLNLLAETVVVRLAPEVYSPTFGINRHFLGCKLDKILVGGIALLKGEDSPHLIVQSEHCFLLVLEIDHYVVKSGKQPQGVRRCCSRRVAVLGFHLASGDGGDIPHDERI